MKNKRKKLTNKELEHRTNVLMSEIDRLQRTIDTFYLTFIEYIEYSDDSDKFEEHLKNNMEEEDVRHKLQKSSS